MKVNVFRLQLRWFVAGCSSWRPSFSPSVASVEFTTDGVALQFSLPSHKFCIFVLCIFVYSSFNQAYMFRATNSSILRSTFDCICSFWYNLPLTRLRWNWSSISTRVTGRQCRCIVTKAVYTVKFSPEDGRICSPKHVRLMKKINKLDLLHLVGCLHRCSSNARSHKHQIYITWSVKAYFLGRVPEQRAGSAVTDYKCSSGIDGIILRRE
jgi:hypothetical protein